MEFRSGSDGRGETEWPDRHISESGNVTEGGWNIGEVNFQLQLVFSGLS